MFAFKKQPRETGLASVGNPHKCVDIKIKGKVCGLISAPSWMRDNLLCLAIIYFYNPFVALIWVFALLGSKQYILLMIYMVGCLICFYLCSLKVGAK